LSISYYGVGMPTSFLGLFFFSTALSLVATFVAFVVQTIVRRVKQTRLR
jgi:hypothetical protein